MALMKVYTVDWAAFVAHTHNYRRVITLGVDSVKTYASPQRVALVDSGEVNAMDNTDLEAVGLTTDMAPTGAPN